MQSWSLLFADLPLIAVAAACAFAVRFGWGFSGERPEFLSFLLAALAIKSVVFLAVGMYRRYWRYASISDVTVLVSAVTVASGVMAVAAVAANLAGVLPALDSVVLGDWMWTLVLIGGLRLGIRMVHEPGLQARGSSAARAIRRVLIVGAGEAGTMVVREMRRNPQLGMEPAGFLDDDSAKLGKHIAGLPVWGATDALPDVVKAHRIDNVTIAMPTAGGRKVRAVLDLCNAAGVTSQTVPGIFELLDGQVHVNRLRNVDIADLLRRSPVEGRGKPAAFVAGRVVLITGAGGSIGSELARQIASAAPAHLVLLGHGENSIFEAEASVRAAFPNVTLSTVIADIRDDRRLTAVFDRIKPEIVFHAAAHKHVPLMEENPEEAVTNNIIGTRNVVAQALRTGSKRFVLISTDKAVVPTSIMGASKRVAEAIVRRAAETSGRAFVAVRFGNVLGSRGSVVHTFKAQIEQGGPITVTHPDMTRYFMTIPEAVHLVLQASGHGKGGELFMLNMGEPVKIVDLARDLIKLSGLREDDVPIVFSGVRAGEKLEEVLVDAGMETVPTSHPDILQVVGTHTPATARLDGVLGELEDAAHRGDRAAIDRLLAHVVPGFVPDPRRGAEGRR